MKKLTEETINTIDSNKTFTHISTIVKELIENSIDANAKSISILLNDSGMSLIEIKDNGDGMTRETLSNLCKRFTSTKISTYSDLSNLETFGFRGEALSILSYISTLTIISRNKESQVGFEAIYRNGKLVNQNNMRTLPCEVGTVVKVEQIFYNNPIRKNAYEKNKLNEMENIINTVSKIAFHYIQISFHLSSGNYMNKILFTNGNDSNESPLQLRKKLGVKLFKQQLSDELFYFDNSTISKDSISNRNLSNINSKFKFECYYTKPSASLQKSKMILFVNNRLVKNSLIQKLFDQTYSKFLIKKGNYFAYLSISCPPEMIDVNVAANKSQIFFLNEEIMFDHFQNMLEEQLKEEINSKNYYIGDYKGFDNDKEILFDQTNTDKKITYDKDKVRVDSNTISIERYVSLVQTGSKGKKSQKYPMEIDDNNNNNNIQLNENEVFKTIYNSLYNEQNENKEDVDINNNHKLISTILKDNFFVGFDKSNSLLFLQYQTSLYIINSKMLIEEYFLYLILSNNSLFIENITIKPSNYTIDDIFNFIYDNFPSKREIIDTLRKSETENLIKERVIPLCKDLISFNDKNNIRTIIIINFFTNSNFIRNFISYLPMIYFSIIEIVFIRTTSKTTALIQENKNLNLIIEILKVLCHYLSNAYNEYISKQSEDFTKKFFRDVLILNIKKDSKFLIRKNINVDNLYEKIIDTETLYTVFERC